MREREVAVTSTVSLLCVRDMQMSFSGYSLTFCARRGFSSIYSVKSQNCQFYLHIAHETIITIAGKQFANTLSETNSFVMNLSSHLTHFFLIAKQLFPGFFTFFHAILSIFKPEHDCYAKFTSCST